MDLIVQWVMQIIVFILIATIIELITPENILKRYVNLVVGLILILIFAQPLLYFLNVDLSAMLKDVELVMTDDDTKFEETKFLIENQKKDIQAEQDAYILSKVKEQLIEEASPQLLEQYNVKISNIEFLFQNNYEDKYEDLDEIIVTILSKNNEQQIKPIVIDLEKQHLNQPKNLQELTNEVTDLLKDVWDLHDKKITVKWEGGTS